MKQYHYERVEKPKKSAFDLSHEAKLTLNVGSLAPCYVQEIIPGDKFSVSQEMLVRNMPLTAPMMHRVNVFTHFFFVPNRILMTNWEDFITGNETINLPKIQGTGTQWATKGGIMSLADYMGMPSTELENYGGTYLQVSALPFRAYQQIYNDYYRDQNLDIEINFVKDETNIEVNSGPGTELLTIRQRNLEKDYFTSALPTPQFGDTVTLPLGGVAPVVPVPSLTDYQPTIYGNVNDSTNPSTGAASFDSTATGGSALKGTDNKFTYIKEGSLQVDLTLATAASVSDLRRAYSLQRYQEKLMRGGRRLKEWTLNIFGVNVPDERLQRAEYLGGGKMGLQISEVIQTYGDDTTENPLAGMAGHGVAGGNITGFSRYFFEHGYIIGIMSILPKTGYFQGLPKNLIKFDKFDYYTPDFAHIGEQAILNKEIYLDPTAPEDTFGYTPRYAEYRDNFDRVHGDFRNTLKYWHMAREFANPPALNSTFIKPDLGSTNRVFAVQSDTFAKFLVQIYLRVNAIRPVSKFGDPI